MLLNVGIGIIVLISIAVFLLTILLLVLLLLFARARLVSSGPVKLTINDKELEVQSGSTLLNTLSSNKIFLPAACGGGGTCGMCRCQVEEGGGSILPTETGFFSKKEQMNNWRLGCQVKVKEDMKIKLAPEILDIKKWECEVISNRNVSTFIKEFVVKLPEGEHLNFKSGGYVQIDVPKCVINYKDFEIEEEYRDEWDQLNMWGLTMKNPEPTYRAYSMACYPAEGDIIKLNIRIATPPWDRKKNGFMKVNPGICSSYIFAQKPGDKVTISGPYGEFFIRESEREMMYIGGGAGMAPMRSHLFHLFKTVKTGRKVSFWYGARTKKEIFYEDEFRAIEKDFPNFKFNIALSEPKEEDNWTGLTGFIHQVIINEYLSKHEEPEEIEYYLCGPPLMNQAIVKMIYDFGIPDEMLEYDDFG